MQALQVMQKGVVVSALDLLRLVCEGGDADEGSSGRS